MSSKRTRGRLLLSPCLNLAPISARRRLSPPPLPRGPAPFPREQPKAVFNRPSGWTLLLGLLLEASLGLGRVWVGSKSSSGLLGLGCRGTSSRKGQRSPPSYNSESLKIRENKTDLDLGSESSSVGLVPLLGVARQLFALGGPAEKVNQPKRRSQPRFVRHGARAGARGSRGRSTYLAFSFFSLALSRWFPRAILKGVFDEGDEGR